jgi:hypothetical protein
MENLKIRTEDIDDVATFTGFGFADLLRQISQHRWLIWAITVIALCTVGSALTAVFLPGARAVLLGEDGIIETGGAVCLASIVFWQVQLPSYLGRVRLCCWAACLASSS